MGLLTILHNTPKGCPQTVISRLSCVLEKPEPWEHLVEIASLPMEDDVPELGPSDISHWWEDPEALILCDRYVVLVVGILGHVERVSRKSHVLMC